MYYFNFIQHFGVCYDNDNISDSVEQMADLLTNPVVKQVAKQTAAAGLAGLTMGGFVRLLSHVSSTSSKQSIDAIKDLLEEEDAQLLSYDTGLLDFLDRFRMFRHMSPEDYESLVKKSVECIRAKIDFYKAIDEKKINSSDLMNVRKLQQEWIECIRLFRAIIELQNPGVIDDFDEVAADCQTFFTQTNESLLFDAQLAK